MFLGTSPPLTEVSRALRARDAEKVSKMSPGASGPGTPKSLKKVSGTVREVSGESRESVSMESVFGVFRDFLETFWGPGRHFRDFFGISGPEGPRDLCKGRAGSQVCSLFTTFTGESNHSHVHSRFTTNGSSECSSIHVFVGDYQQRHNPWKQTDKQIWERGGEWWCDARGPLAFQSQIARTVLSGTSVWRPQSRYTVSRIECRIKFPQNQRCRAKIALHPPPNKGVAPFSGPPCRTFLSFAASRGRGGLVESIAALLGSENGSRYRGVSQLQSHQSRYSVQLSANDHYSLSSVHNEWFTNRSNHILRVATTAEPCGEKVNCTNSGRWKTFRKVPVRHF